MSKFVIYLELKPFIAQWAFNHFGNPIEFPAQSVGNSRISGKRFIVDYIEALFNDSLYGEFREMFGKESKLQTVAYAWCEMHGVSIDYADTIRQRFYRERERLLACGVDLRKRSRTKNEKKY